MVEVGQGLPGIAAGVEQSGGEQVLGVPGGVADEAHATGLEAGLGLLPAGAVGGQHGEQAVLAVGAAELLEDGVGVGLEAEDGVQAARWACSRRKE